MDGVTSVEGSDVTIAPEGDMLSLNSGHAPAAAITTYLPPACALLSVDPTAGRAMLHPYVIAFEELWRSTASQPPTEDAPPDDEPTDADERADDASAGAASRWAPTRWRRARHRRRPQLPRPLPRLSRWPGRTRPVRDGGGY